MSLFLQIMICIWIIFTVAVIIGYSANVSNKDFTGLINLINESETLNLFGKIFSIGPMIDVPEPTVLKKLLVSQFVNQTAFAKLPKEETEANSGSIRVYSTVFSGRKSRKKPSYLAAA